LHRTAAVWRLVTIDEELFWIFKPRMDIACFVALVVTEAEASRG
jgi:hypothetical protein